MKKFLSIILVVCLVMSLAACSGKTDSKAADNEAGEAGETGEDALKIMLILPGTSGDKSFLDSALAGLNDIKEKYGDKVEIKCLELGYDQTKYEPALYGVCEEGWDIIATVWYTMAEPVKEVAPQFPDTKFIICDATVELDNVYSIIYRPNEGSFLVGYLGSKLSETNQIGFVGGMNIPSINDFLVGYIQGAQYASEDTKVVVGYVGSFKDPAKAKEISIAQFNKGCDISYNVAGKSGLGLIEAAVEMDKLALGVDADQAMVFDETEPEKSNVIPTSMIKDVGGTILQAVDKYIDGSIEFGTVASVGIKEGVIGLAQNKYYEKMVSEELRSEIDEVAQKISDGEIEVKTVIGLTPEELDEIVKSAQ